MKKPIIGLALLAAAAIALSGCSTPPQSDPSKTGTGQAAFRGCMISDAGGFDDKSFNQTSYAGMTRAKSELGIELKQAESTSQSDFEPNLDSMVAQDCDLIVTVGFNLAEATKASATANSEIKYAIVDDNSIELPNVQSLVFKTSDAAFLAGYAAAAYSTTGKVATFGGLPIPTVTIFMDGFADGVDKYNEDSGKSVQVLGWNKAEQNGSFSGGFDDQSAGQNLANGFIEQGADVIMPVAGPVGNGAAAAARTAGNVAIIWVDTDGYISNPDYKDLFLTSVQKKMDEAVFEAVKTTQAGQFSNQQYVGTLANAGVDIAPFHDFDAKISDEAKAKIDDLRQQIISGSLKVSSPSDPKIS